MEYRQREYSSQPINCLRNHHPLRQILLSLGTLLKEEEKEREDDLSVCLSVYPLTGCVRVSMVLFAQYHSSHQKNSLLNCIHTLYLLLLPSFPFLVFFLLSSPPFPSLTRPFFSAFYFLP